MTVMTGTLASYPLPDNAPDFKGSVIIEWPASAPKAPAEPPKIPPTRVMPAAFTTVRDEQDGEIIPCAGITIHAQGALVTADVAVFLDKSGEIIRDPGVIWRESDGIPATFPYLVAEIRVG